MTLIELKARLDSFSPVQVEFVAQVMDSLAHPPSTIIQQTGTWLTESPEWTEYFGLALSVHHSATAEPLGLTAFETVFRNACEHMGWTIDPPRSRTRRFVDLTVRASEGSERRLSLKSTAARNLSRGFVHISKLTEAAWVQDTRTARARRTETRDLFQAYQSAVSEIIMLRAFRPGSGQVPYRYQLVEIPASIFDSIQSAPLALFERDAPRIDCLVDGVVSAVVAIDRSDAKITVRRIQISACTVHAEWSRE